MTVYNINRGIGWASSGVEYAQAYRAQVFRHMGVKAEFIFTDMFQEDNLEALTSAIGFQDDEVIWLYQYFTDFPIAPCTVTREEIEETFSGPWRRREQGGTLPDIYYFDQDASYVRVYRKYGGFVQRVEYVLRERLVRTDYYTTGRLFSEFYAPKDGRAKLYCRRFYNRDGSEAFLQIVDGDRKIYRMKDAVLYSKEEFIGYFIARLGLTAEDVIIMDRSTEIGQGLLMHKGAAKLGIVVHAEHWNDNLTDTRHILWNNYYEYDFDHAADTAFYVTATDAQRKVLSRQFHQYCHLDPRIVPIPVGALKALRYPQNSRPPHAFITASRLSSEKHIDWLVQAAAAAHEEVSDLTLDIYGSGKERESLAREIQALHAESYIRLRGHQDLTHVYTQYSAYVSASTSEGFGLTLMEAVGSGLAMIGLDVPYGNQTFIQEEKNGYLIPYSPDTQTQQLIAALAERMVRLCTKADLSAFEETSYQIASRYLEQNVESAWHALLTSL